jgi:hypothetical protein
MTKKNNQLLWLAEQVPQNFGGAPEMGAGGPPMSQPGSPQDPMGQDSMSQGVPDQMQSDQPPAGMSLDNQSDNDEDITNDPEYPDMPEEKEEDDDFEIWKIKFVKESIKGNPNSLAQRILNVRDMDLEPHQRKFAEDNLDICFLRQNSNILQISNEIRKLIKNDFDRTNPAMTLVRHITTTLEQSPLLNEVYIKLLGLGGSKGDQHRKFVAALTGSVQVGSGGQNEDLVFEEKDYSIRISTRFNSRWGDVNIGRWFLREDDSERYLKKAELDRLEGGSPEEKDVLRRRVVIESISESYRERAFIINVVGQDGTVCHLGWDLGNSLKSAFLDGKLVVRTNSNDLKEAFIDEEGSVISIPNMNICYLKESEQLDKNGNPEIDEIEFIAHRDGVLYLVAQLDLIKEAASTLQSFTYKETLWQGNPSDILKIMRCVPSSPEILLRQC